VAIGIVARLLFVFGWTWGVPIHGGDPLFFQQTAAQIAHGNGYVGRFLGKGPLVPTAGHPPAFSFVLAALDLVHIRSIDAHRVALAFISAGGVLAMGLLGRRLAGPGVGLLAAGIAALDPLWVQWGGYIMSESIYLVVIPTMLLVALRCIDRPTRWNFATLGVLIGVATLTRSEAVDFVVLLGLVVVALAASRWRDRIVFGVVFLAGVTLIVGPWLIRNEVQMGAPMLSSDGGTTLSGSYAPTTFSPSNPDYGGFDNNAQFGLAVLIVKWERPPNHAKSWTERSLSGALSNDAKSYALNHLSDLPGVVLAREGRVWGVYAPSAQLNFDVGEDDNGARGPKQAGQILNWVLLLFAIVGGVQLARRSRRRFIVLAAPLVVVALNAALFYGSTRLRVAAEPSIAVLAAFGALWGIERIRHAPSAGPI
jgi:4-amino-4-deoxy-L-arabinose transferase-like glycosyltransferase